MAKATLNVTVNGGNAPFPIQVRFFMDGVLVPPNISSETSFSHVFDGLLTGHTYDICIGGFNPKSPGSSTICTLTLDPGINLNPPDDSPITKQGVSYAVDFNISL